MAESANLSAGMLKNRTPVAVAAVTGSEAMPNVSGSVYFYAAPGGTIVSADVQGLPPITLPQNAGEMQTGPFGFHIHEGMECGSPGATDTFGAAGGHYNPTNQPHPLHAGDLPVLFPNNGRSSMQVYTNRFTPQDVIGRTVVIHQSPDDFRTQPAGNSGTRIGCGPVTAY